MALCGRCGSIQVVRVPGNILDDTIALVTKHKLYACQRCGWRGRSVEGTDNSERQRMALDPTAAYDPTLATLDEFQDRADRAPRRPRRHRRKPVTKAVHTGEPDLSTLDELHDAPITPYPEPQEANNGSRSNDRSRHRSHSRTGRSRRRGFLAALAVSGLALFLIAMVGITDSCGSRLPTP
jgi:hypothetical protein